MFNNKKTIYKEGRQCLTTKKLYIRRGDNVDPKKIYKEGRQCLTTTKKLYIRRGDNVDQKKTI